MSAPDWDDSSGQHRAAGNVLLALGVTGTFVGLALAILHFDLRFIDARAMTMFGAGMAAVGIWQRATAKKLARSGAG